METLESFGYLQVYKGYALFKREGGKIIKSSLGETKGRIETWWGKRFILVNGDLGMSEQIKTLIHEFLHFSYDPCERLGPCGLWPKKEYEELEDKIEKETFQVYESQPRLMNHLRELLLEAPYRENYRLEIKMISKKYFPWLK